MRKFKELEENAQDDIVDAGADAVNELIPPMAGQPVTAGKNPSSYTVGGTPSPRGIPQPGSPNAIR